MEVNTFLAFDIGATSGRAVLMEFKDGKFEMEEIHRFSNGILELHERYYWDIFHIYNELKEALRYCGKRNIRLTSVGIDTWGVDFGFVGPDGVILGLPRAYRDPYTEKSPERFFTEKMSRKEVYERTGIQIMNFNSLFQLYQMSADSFSPLSHASAALLIPDLLSYMLTGKMVCEYTDASTTQIVNPYTKKIDEELLNAAGVPASLFREIVFREQRLVCLRKLCARKQDWNQFQLLQLPDTIQLRLLLPFLRKTEISRSSAAEHGV